MRILITGGCGFLGSHLVEHFLKTTDHDIVVLDKLTYASSGFDRLRDVVERLPDDVLVRPFGMGMMSDRLSIVGCDLSQPIPRGVVDEVHGSAGSWGIDYVIHAAAESHVDNSITDPLPFLMSNVIGTHHLLTSDLVTGVNRVFMVSTDEVYGPAPWGHPGFDEAAAFRPANPYAASKAGAECVAFAYANTYKLPITIVNTMNLIGERQHPEKFVPLVIRKVLNGETVTIHADPTKTRPGTRFYLHCRTFANALGWLIDEDRYGMVAMRAGARPGDVYAVKMPSKIHVCGERELSNLELAQTIAGFVGKELKYELVDFHSSRPGHDLRYAMDDSQIRGMGWKRPMGILGSLKKTVEWYLANPRWLGGDAPKRIARPIAIPAPVPPPTPTAERGDFPRYAAGEEVRNRDIVTVEGRARAGMVTGFSVSPPKVRVDFSELTPSGCWEAVIVDPSKCNLIRRADAKDQPPPGTKLNPWADELNEAAASELEPDMDSEDLSQYVALGADEEVQAEPIPLRSNLRSILEHELEDDPEYQVGIFANPLGSDHLRDQVCRSALEEIRERVEVLESTLQRDGLKQSANVEIVDGFLSGCRGVVSDVVGDVPLYEVKLTWSPNGDGAKYLNSHVVLPAEQLRVIP